MPGSSALRFDFTLAPVEDVDLSDFQLGWFGLTWGSYSIDLGTARLFEYSELPGWPRHVEYQLARLHADLLTMLPAVLAPFPADIAQSIEASSFRKVFLALDTAWWEAEARDASRETLDATLPVFQHRRLDSLYLSPSANIDLWRDGGRVVIEWDNRDQLVEGKPAWTALEGRHEVPVPLFQEAVSAFHERLMREMRDRIEALARKWSGTGVEIDFDEIRAHQRSRESWLEHALRRPYGTVDWDAVRVEVAALKPSS